MTLLLSFSGWCLQRLATDPDPTDEPRGVSGYTFAFPGEPDLDRIVRFQPPDRKYYTPRSYAPKVGVTVDHAVRTETGEDIPELEGATVDLVDDPKLENRNWTLTLPGFEPIVPFHIRITSPDVQIARDAPLNPDDPAQPVWKAPADVLKAQGASGINFEPHTVGYATGQWNSLQIVRDRLHALKGEMKRARGDKKAAFRGRIRELEIGVKKPSDRRVSARYFVERFSFSIVGPASVVDPAHRLGGQLDDDADTGWDVAFWLGAWDPDVLCSFAQGSITIPYRPEGSPG